MKNEEQWKNIKGIPVVNIAKKDIKKKVYLILKITKWKKQIFIIYIYISKVTKKNNVINEEEKNTRNNKKILNNETLKKKRNKSTILRFSELQQYGKILVKIHLHSYRTNSSWILRDAWQKCENGSFRRSRVKLQICHCEIVTVCIYIYIYPRNNTYSNKYSKYLIMYLNTNIIHRTTQCTLHLLLLTRHNEILIL